MNGTPPFKGDACVHCLPQLELAPGGWIKVDELLQAAKENKFPISEIELKQVVEQNDKQRFSFDERPRVFLLRPIS